ncbi:MAG: GNAT family N-acetyltransferase, partial [Dehalococcoidia bacterium]|nr:GNAT family N-acetyltransferase [Dehalococcoidia bacterium]
WADLAEVKSLAVSEDKQAKGLGSVLIEACLDEARELGIPTVFCLSYKPAFFEKYNFRRVDKMELPRKVWSECYRCPKFPDCDEVALIYQFQSDVK